MNRAAADAPRVLVIDAHPRAGSLVSELARAYAGAARASGATVTALALRDLDFNPDVTCAHPQDQVLEADLENALHQIRLATHLVIAYPIWWGAMPARLKGFFDRVFLPGIAFRERPGHEGYEPLWRDKSADVLVTMDTPPAVFRWWFHEPGITAVVRSTLTFCGISVQRVRRFGPVNRSTADQRQQWLDRARGDGASAGRYVCSPRERIGARLASWMAALRLQFYPMVWMAYVLGALAATGSLAALVRDTAFWIGWLMLFLLEAATVFINELEDRPSDLRNTHYGPFNGGSRVLVDGRLTALQVRRAAVGCLATAFVAAAVVHDQLAPAAWTALMALVILASGYTLPPLRLSWRTFGELDVAITNGLAPVLLGWLLQGGAWDARLPWLLGLPIACSILPAITLAGLPDREADRAVGKRTVAVRFGASSAVRLVQISALIAWTIQALAWPITSSSMIATVSIWAGSGLHAMALAYVATRCVPAGASPRRIDGPLIVALSFILWFVVSGFLAIETRTTG